MSEKIYVVTLHNREDLDGFYDDMKDNGFRLNLKRPISRNTHYWMTDEQAEELKHTDAGVINCVVEPLVITSARTPEPATGSVVSFLDESAVLLPVSLYSVTHAA